MLASIHPLGERARRSRWGVTVAAHLLGSAVGGGLAGAAAAGLGAVVLRRVALGPGGALASVAVVCAAGALADGMGRGRLWPTLRRQVDRAWLGRYRGWVYGLGFGVQLGAGVTTVVTTAAVHATLLLAFLSRDPVAGLLVGTAFGAARGLPLAGLWWVQRPDQLWAVHRRLQAGFGRARAAGVAVMAATGGLAGAAAAGLPVGV